MEDQKDVAPSESVCAPGAASDLVPNTNMMEKRQYNWKDITADFVEASSDLALGELLHDATFGLFEAMSAIEMMDPKMDAGMLCNQLQRKVLSLPEALETGDIKVKGFQIPELVGIMDATLACIVTWLEGHSLAQTVFTNLYLHNPYIIEDRCLKAFCICTLKIVDHIRDRVNRAGVFEEEDFQTMSYGFKMAADVSDVRCTGMMKEVEEDLNRTIKTTRSKQGEERNADVEKEHELTNALFARVRFQKLFFSMLLLSEKEKCEGIPQARKTVSQLKELLPIMKSTVDIGIQPQNREVGKNDYPTIMGFEPFVNQRLLPPTFPRYTAICSRSDALQYMDEFLSRVNVVFSITDMTSLHPVLETFKDFSKSSPCVLSRSLLQLTFLPPNKRAFGVHMMTDFLKDTVRGFIAPPALSQKSALYNNYHAKSYVDAWFLQTVRPICNLIQITGHNRARQRDKWAQILEDLSLLQEEADKVDAFLHQLLVKTEPTRQHIACLGNWVLYHTIQVMISYLLSGFELELYATYEYHYIYWYLYELLYSWMTNTLHRADNFLLEHETLAESQVKGRNTKKNKKKKRTKTLTREITMAQAEQQMFGGYYKAVVGFRLDGKMSRPQFEFDSEEIQYSHRFSPFTNVSTPPFIHYSQYKEMSNYKRYEPDAAAINCYSDSCKCFFQAKTMLESLGPQDEEIQTMIRVAKTNFVVMKLLIGGHKKDSNEPPEFDFSLHNVYPVLKLN